MGHNKTMGEFARPVSERFPNHNKTMGEFIRPVSRFPNSNKSMANGVPWDTTESGVYASAVSGKMLFSSAMKHESGFESPSFSEPIEESRLYLRHDPDDKMEKPNDPLEWRVEVLDRDSMTHVGYVYPGGPGPSGRRYIVNAA